MRKFLLFIGLVFFLALANTTFSSCSPKVGCELNEEMGPKTNRNGDLSKKRGKSNLFGKKQRKRMGL